MAQPLKIKVLIALIETQAFTGLAGEDQAHFGDSSIRQLPRRMRCKLGDSVLYCRSQRKVFNLLNPCQSDVLRSAYREQA
ncbi:MAG: hypothetical protein EA386_03980 [Rhodobacteraceae bacterium]|nr:MAG: hypothetical protein EA386_03980 [Paracoccaceae bacterium]